jgi:hypothetical protein
MSSLLAAICLSVMLIAPPVVAAQAVGVVEYNLGDTAFSRDEFAGPSELRAVVHYPKQRSQGPRPLVLQLHGMWWTCVDTARHQPTMDWPCPPGQVVLPNYRGYDNLGEQLAGKGFVVVSIGVSGINSANPGAAYTDRAHLINKHLSMWRELSATGGGQLAGRFYDPATGRPQTIDFTGQVDLGNVGVMGHSRGGMAAMLHASEAWRPSWPQGVRIKAVLPTGAVYNHVEPAEVTGVPFAVLGGTCDSIKGSKYFDDVQGRTNTRIHEFSIHGANHNFFNTQWSPGSGQAGAVDDASHAGLSPGQCTDGNLGSTPERQLTEQQQRLVGSAYASAFFQRYLQGRFEFDPVLTGRIRPFAWVTPVDVRYS